MRVFADSGGWYSMLVESDLHHEAGKRYFETLVRARVVVTTSDFVLDEVITRLRYDAGHPTASDFIAWMNESVSNRILRVIRVTDAIWTRAEELFLQYADSKLSFTDCTSFAILDQNPVDEVFGYDSHFEMMGHIMKPK